MPSRTRRRSLAALLLTVTLGASACSGSGGSAELTAPEVPSFGDLPEQIDYVALGDSYSAGPLITTIRSDPSGCVRSTDNYAAFLAGWLSVESYRDVTCSGADTADLTHRQPLPFGGTVPPQLAALSPDTDLVTVGIGGNDFGIFSSLVGCGPGGDACTPALQRRLMRDAGRVESRVARVVGQVVERAPDAEVYVVGYPQVLPTDDGCRAVPLPADRLEAAATVAQRLNDSLRAGAESAGARLRRPRRRVRGRTTLRRQGAPGSTVRRRSPASPRRSTRSWPGCGAWPARCSPRSPATRPPRPRRPPRRAPPSCATSRRAG